MKKTKNEYGSKANLVDNEGKNEDTSPPAGGKEDKGDLTFVEAPVTPANDGVLQEEILEERVLTPDEKSFLLCVERGDVTTAKNIIKAMSKRSNIFDLNCVDPLGRSALIISVENENPGMIEMLLEHDIKPKDALLVAIREDYVDGVEILLKHEEENHKEGDPYSWEAMEGTVANFTADITPLILAAHRNNYEILKMLLDRGATIPLPHDVKCSCEECVTNSAEDSLKFSLARINAYRALASPSLIALSASDPILTAFQLSDELKNLARAESQFRAEYIKLRKQVQEFVTGLIDNTRTSYELETILNHNPDGEPWKFGDFQTLERLKLAIKYKQKSFVAHPSVQQLLGAIWYEGLPGFRRKNIACQILDILKLACMFPINSMLYIIAPHSSSGKFMRNPFVKFVSHSASYFFFLFLLALASQRIEHVVISLITFLAPETTVGQFLAEVKYNWEKYERGSIPHFVELLIALWVQGLVWAEIKQVYTLGLFDYFKNLWNLANIFSYGSFMSWIGLRALSWLIVQKEIWDGVDPEQIWIPKEEWAVFEPQLLAEAMFGAGMISAYLKIVYILSINPFLGPLQIALGKMVMDILKWMFLFILVVFAFGCGMNQLLWYYADLEKQECYSLPGGLPDFENKPESCVSWRRFANLWETSQSLFWASFGLVDLGDFDLKGIKEFTRFWGLLMFGSYSVCNIIVLLNMLIAMMSNSYQAICEKSDTEWKFSRSKLWISYFNPGATVPTPFNLIPSPKSLLKVMCCKKEETKVISDQEVVAANKRYNSVMKFVIRRYITNEQRKSEDYSITEDDIQEVRQDINSFKYELMDILKDNNMKVPDTKRKNGILNRKSKNMERQIQKGFQITKIEGVMEAFFTASQEEKPKDVFKRFARMLNDKNKRKMIELESQRRSSIRRDPIGSTQASIRRHRNSLKRSLFQRGNSQAEIKMVLTRLNSEELVAFNPHLSEYAPAARRAYAKFKSALDNYNEKYYKDEVNTTDEKKRSSVQRTHSKDSIRKLIMEKAKSIESISDQTSLNKSVAELERKLATHKDEQDRKEAEEKQPGKTPTPRQPSPVPGTAPKSPAVQASSKSPAVQASPKPPAKSDPAVSVIDKTPEKDPTVAMQPDVSQSAMPKSGIATPKSPTSPAAKGGLTPMEKSAAASPSLSHKDKATPSRGQVAAGMDSSISPSRGATAQSEPRTPAKTPVTPHKPMEGGIVNKGFDEPMLMVSAPSIDQSSPGTPQSLSPHPSKKGDGSTPASVKPSPMPSPTPSRKSEKLSRPPSAKPSPGPSPKSAKGDGPQDSSKGNLFVPRTPQTPRASTPAPEEEVPVGQFDPEGKSAVSGQKRTGWI